MLNSLIIVVHGQAVVGARGFFHPYGRALIQWYDLNEVGSEYSCQEKEFFIACIF